MVETPHVIVGAAIATKIGNPALALPLALGAHFVLDLIPHWNPHLHTETKKHGKPLRKSNLIVVIDSTIALIAGLLIASRALPNLTQVLIIVAACLLSVLPDLVEAPYYFLSYRPKWLKKYVEWHRSGQADAPLFRGVLIQLIVIGAALYWVFH